MEGTRGRTRHELWQTPTCCVAHTSLASVQGFLARQKDLCSEIGRGNSGEIEASRGRQSPEMYTQQVPSGGVGRVSSFP